MGGSGLRRGDGTTNSQMRGPRGAQREVMAQQEAEAWQNKKRASYDDFFGAAKKSVDLLFIHVLTKHYHISTITNHKSQIYNCELQKQIMSFGYAPLALKLFHGPEGRSLYCLNLNCRAPPGQLLQPDLSFR